MNTKIWQPLTDKFKMFYPFEGAQADTDVMMSEFTDMIGYAVKFISLFSLDYHSVWWRLFIRGKMGVAPERPHPFQGRGWSWRGRQVTAPAVPNSTRWLNILVLTALLFSLPASSEKLESLLRTRHNNSRQMLLSHK